MSTLDYPRCSITNSRRRLTLIESSPSDKWSTVKKKRHKKEKETGCSRFKWENVAAYGVNAVRTINDTHNFSPPRPVIAPHNAPA